MNRVVDPKFWKHKNIDGSMMMFLNSNPDFISANLGVSKEDEIAVVKDFLEKNAGKTVEIP